MKKKLLPVFFLCCLFVFSALLVFSPGKPGRPAHALVPATSPEEAAQKAAWLKQQAKKQQAKKQTQQNKQTTSPEKKK